MALSVKMDLGIGEVDVDSLFQKARTANIPFHTWYQWVPEQIHILMHKTELENTLQQLEEEEMDKLRAKMKGHATKCSLCKCAVEEGKIYLFESFMDKTFCRQCYDKVTDTMKKKGAQQPNSRTYSHQ